MLNKFYKRKQRTIGEETSIKGIGLHTGVETIATFKPAKENFGIRFKRLDLKNCPEIKFSPKSFMIFSERTNA